MKDVFRKGHLAARKKTSAAELEEKARLIEERLFSLSEFREVALVMFYVGIKSEIPTKEMIASALKQGKRIAVPVTDFENNLLLIAEIKSLNELREKRFGLLEPELNKRNAISAGEIDLIVVPGIAFDFQGNRIGYGHGFYDGLLQKTGKIHLIGLALEDHLIERIPEESHDRKVDKVVTEKRVVEC